MNTHTSTDTVRVSRYVQYTHDEPADQRGKVENTSRGHKHGVTGSERHTLEKRIKVTIILRRRDTAVAALQNFIYVQETA